MNLTHRSVVLLAIMMLFIVLLPAITGLVGLIEEDELPDGDDYALARTFIVALARMTIHQMLSGLIMGMSMFTLFVVYLGGRSNHRRFNDRTIAAINLFRGIFSATALLRAVFVFLSIDSLPVNTNKQLNRNPYPIMIHSTRRY